MNKGFSALIDVRNAIEDTATGGRQITDAKAVMIEPPKCEHCNRILVGNELTPREDPYAREMRGDASLHLICDSCCRESARDI